METADSYEAVIAAPVGLLGVRLRAEQLVAIDIAPPHQSPRPAASTATGLGGFMGRVDGQPLAVKEWLLAHESRG